jgi:biopolymer transport protein ExbB/TolQ
MTTLQVEFWQLITLLASMLTAFVASIWALSKALLRQFQQDLKQRFAHQEQLRQEARAAHDQRFAAIETAVSERERDLLRLRAELPVHYVRREDAIRSETVINAKLDALATKIDLVAERVTRGDK